MADGVGFTIPQGDIIGVSPRDHSRETTGQLLYESRIVPTGNMHTPMRFRFRDAGTANAPTVTPLKALNDIPTSAAATKTLRW